MRFAVSFDPVEKTSETRFGPVRFFHGGGLAGRTFDIDLIEETRGLGFSLDTIRQTLNGVAL